MFGDGSQEIVGTTIFKLDGNSYYTRERPRGATKATFAIEVRNLVGSPSLSVAVETRNYDLPNTWTGVLFSTITDIGNYTLDMTSIEELFRLKLDFGSGGAASAGAHIVEKPTMWIPD